ncbi:hypothetical protein [Thiocystis violacea]|uniref:IS66 family transposase n=1 Tax=Thiocystis violacea TaxID=13725 RepID=UPI003B8318FD
MSSPAQSLPEAPAERRAIIAQLTEQLADAERERQAQQHHIEPLLETIELLKRQRFGRSADQVPDSQRRLFDETELEALTLNSRPSGLRSRRRTRPRTSPRPRSANPSVALYRVICPASNVCSISPRTRRRRWARTGPSSVTTPPSRSPSCRARPTSSSTSVPSMFLATPRSSAPRSGSGSPRVPSRSSPSRSPTAHCWQALSPPSSSMPCHCIDRRRSSRATASPSSARPWPGG